MPGWLQKLRSKSQVTRHRIALGTSISVTCLIFVMWVTVLNYGVDNEVDSLQADAGETQTASPLSAFGNNAASAFQQLKGSFSSKSSSSTPTTEEEQKDEGEDFWADQRSSDGSVSGKQNVQAVSSTSESDESFTSRNYNPSQESDWFSN